MLERYELVRLVGRGGMGEVYEAIDRETKRRVAVKRLHVGPGVAADVSTRFSREILATAQIMSRHVVAVHDAGVDDDHAPFMVMDLLDGEDLGALADRLGTLPVDLALRLVAQACDGLVAAHAVGIIHRDIKPSNLFLVAPNASGTRIVKILDFGIARIRSAGIADELTELTRTGAIVGSPLYMAPEQLRGIKTLDHRADVWSLGVVLYRLLCGHVPHASTSIADLLIKVCSDPAPPLRDRAPWVSREVAELVHRALQIDPDARVPSARVFADELAQLLPTGSTIDAASVRAHEPVAAPALAHSATISASDAVASSGGASSLGGSAPAGVRATPKSTAPRPVTEPPRSSRLAAPKLQLPPIHAEPRGPSVRAGYLIALVLAGAVAAGVLAYRAMRPKHRAASPPDLAAGLPDKLARTAAATWFAQVRTRCNAVELRSVLEDTPPPPDDDGAAFAAACAALAGDLALAREKILSTDDHRYASWPMFEIAHPLADRRNDDPAVAEIMRLVIEFWPENFMALYHAGVTEFIAADPRALDHLRSFRRIYPHPDAFVTTADRLLAELASPSPHADCARIVATDPEGHDIHPPGCH